MTVVWELHSEAELRIFVFCRAYIFVSVMFVTVRGDRFVILLLNTRTD
jgi:hypothetical protein